MTIAPVGLVEDGLRLDGSVHTDTTNTIRGSADDDRLVGGDQGDKIVGMAGDDTIIGGLGFNVLIGGSGRDTVSYAHAQEGGVSVDLISGQASNLVGESGFFDELHSIENVIGSRGADAITGDAKANLLYGGAGDDFIDSGGGGRDTIQGGGGYDVVVFRTAEHGVTLDLGSADPQASGVGLLQIASIEGVIGSFGDDHLTGDALDNRLLGENGDDLVAGGDGADSIEGGAGANTLEGGAGDDLLVVADQDDLSGGPGADVFRLTNLNAAGSVIEDLDADDTIDLRAIDADSTQRHNQKFVLVDDFDGHAGQATIQTEGGFTYLRLDVDGDALADATLTIVGDHSDFDGLLL